MSGTLIVWKGPVVHEARAAARLLGDYYATGDEAAFDASPDVARFYDEIVALYPVDRWNEGGEADETPTWAGAPQRSDRVVTLDYSWSAPDVFLEDMKRLAVAHELVLYDPQGPDVHLPDEPPAEPYTPDAREAIRVALIGIGALLVAIGAWFASIPIVSWSVIVLAGFMALMAAANLFVYARQAYERRAL